MKKLILFPIVTFLLIFPIHSQKKTLDSLWTQVENYELKKLPKSALKLVDSIYRLVESDKNSSQTIKALIYKSKFSLTLEEDAQLLIIEDFKKHIKNSSFPTKNILNNMLANLYWQYFKKNRYRIYSRTRTNNKIDSLDFRTWDINTLFNEIHEQYQKAFTNKDSLLNSKITPYKDVMFLKEDSEIYRPTLYDFLAHNALDFYKTPENSITKPAFQFKIDDLKYFSNAETFSKIKLESKDSLSLQFNTLKIYQQLLANHLTSNNKKALAVVDIERLKFINQNATFNIENNAYLKALLVAQKKYNDHEISGLYSFEIATLFNNSNHTNNHTPKKAEALLISNKVIEKFPLSLGAKKCQALKAIIEEKTLIITSEEFIPINKPSRILINYKNIDSLYFNAYRITKNQLEKLNKLYNIDESITHIKSLKKVKGWSKKLKNINDYLQHSTEVIVPELNQGTYLILASENKDLNSKSIFGTSFIQVTNIVLIESNKYGKYTYQVVNRNNGSPLKNALINIKSTKKSKHQLNKTLRTNSRGFAYFKNKHSKNHNEVSVKFKHDKAHFGRRYFYQYLSKKEIKNEIESYGNRDEIIIKPHIFTDRSIYRPGQTVYFKAIVLKKQGEKKAVFKNEYLSVILYDSNEQEVKTLELKLNEFGSVFGKFQLPNNGLTGEYSIEIEESERDSKFFDNENYDFDYNNDSYTFSVEEYKRPKFKPEFQSVKKIFAINDSVTVTGFAKSFSGANITNAKVTYRVNRKTHYPDWYYWKNRGSNNSSLEIKFGKTTTNSKGEFQITFKAIADETIPKENLPVFTYQITADITDINGETRSTSKDIKVGYHHINLNLESPSTIDKEKKAVFKIHSENLNGVFTPTLGTFTIHKLNSPKAPLRKRPWNAPDFQDIPEKLFRELFPNDPYTNNESNENNWKKGELIFQTNFDTSKEKKIVLDNLHKYKSGKYIVSINTIDTNKLEVKDQKKFRLYSYQEKSIADNKLFFIQTDKTFYKPNEKVALKLSSASEDITVSLQIEKDHKIKKTILVNLKNESKIINIPIKNKDVGGFAINYHFVNYNAFVKGNQPIYIPKKVRTLQIKTNVFRDKLQPGQKDTWSFTIRDDKNNALATELLASMYDASLDEFKNHRWEFNPNPYLETYSSYNTNHANNSFGTTNFNIRNRKKVYFNYHKLQFSTYNWFGLDLSNSYWKEKQYLSKLKRARESQRTIASISKSGKYTGIISGRVSDNSGVLPGVSVLIKGTTRGTESDFDGNYQIYAKPGDILSYSYLGYKTTEVVVGKFSSINVTLEEDANVLDEVVVMALGIKREKQSLGFAVQGKVAGVTVQEQKTKEKLVNKLSSIKARKNFNETAFFYPKLRTDKNGKVSFNFTVPEALTKWKLQLLAHTKKLEFASKTLATITQKELMVSPNAPRFLRQGDTITISTKITNLTNNKIKGFAQLSLTNALTGEAIDKALNNIERNKDFSVEKENNTSVSWRIIIPNSLQAIQYKIVATNGLFSDGEQNVLPVLTNRKLVTEALPLMVRSNQTKGFTLEKLQQNKSTSIENHKLTLEITSNPAWNAVKSLPYLMEYPYECAEQTFSKFYANSLASHIANSNPKIQEVFNSWKSSNTLISNLEKNQELKSLIINETPWLRDAQSESEQKKRLGLLFDFNKMKNEKEKAINKLSNMQLSNGGFPWFKGGLHANNFISQHIATGFGHLKKIGLVEFKPSTKKMISSTVMYLDIEILKLFLSLKEQAKKIEKRKSKIDAEKYLNNNHLNYFVIQYLYMRSFYPNIEIEKSVQEAVNYYANQSKTFWSEFNLYGKAQIALVNFRNGNTQLAKDIIKSLKENSITSDELGMYWKSNISGYSYYQSQVETQSLIIEAFSEINNDRETIDNLKIWLLKHKQTNQWKTTISTSKAIYALLFNGSDWFSKASNINVTIGGKKIDSTRIKDTKIEAGTGYYKVSWNKKEISPALSTIKIEKKDDGISWGAIYWQYFEDLDKITLSKSPLQINKKLFIKTNSNTGKVLNEITPKTVLKVGDLITVRIEIKSDRDMEFIHMKDMRASSLEPIEVLSKYKWQDGLGYYQSIKDASTNFFFDFIPKGIYVFEYDLRVNNSGNFSNGITTIQSMYAPEFTSHSKGVRINIK